MPRIPAALAVAITVALCIGFNVTRYPVVFEMVAPDRLSGAADHAPLLASTSPSKPSPQQAEKPAAPASVQAAYCTPEGDCYSADGKPLASKPGKKPADKPAAKSAQKRSLPAPETKPMEATPNPRFAALSIAAPPQTPPSTPSSSPAEPKLSAEMPKALNESQPPPSVKKSDPKLQQPAPVAQAPARKLVPVVRPEAVAQAGAALAMQTTPVSGSHREGRGRVERLPRASDIAVLSGDAKAAAVPPADWLPIYPTTRVR